MKSNSKALLFAVGLCFAGAGTVYAEQPLAVAVAQAQGLSEADAQKQVQSVFDAIRTELAAGREVQVRTFGTFYVQERAPRAGRNPKTGEALQIPAKKYPRFRSSDVLKRDVQDKEA